RTWADRLPSRRVLRSARAQRRFTDRPSRRALRAGARVRSAPLIPPRSERPKRSSRIRRPARGLLQSKLAPPARRPGCVLRAGLVNRLRVERDARVVMVSAPRGYGKTTLVSDWARRDGRPFGWYTISG